MEMPSGELRRGCSGDRGVYDATHRKRGFNLRGVPDKIPYLGSYIRTKIVEIYLHQKSELSDFLGSIANEPSGFKR